MLLIRIVNKQSWMREFKLDELATQVDWWRKRWESNAGGFYLVERRREATNGGRRKWKAECGGKRGGRRQEAELGRSG